MANRVAIIGSGQTDHASRRVDVRGQELIAEAVSRALEDCELGPADIDGVVIGNMDHFEGINYVDCWSVEGFGGAGKPVIKLTTGGTTGSTLAAAGFHLVASGMFDRLLVIGWEKNSESDTTGAITTAFDPIWDRMVFAGAIAGLAVEAKVYMERYGATPRDAARVSVRDRRHACLNPHAHLRKAITVEEVLASPMLSDPLHLLDLCPRTDGACAVVFAAEGVAEKLCPRPAWILGTASRHPYTYVGDVDFTDEAGLLSMRQASRELFAKIGVRDPLREFDVIELYQPYSWAGLSWIEDLGLCAKGEAPRLIEDGVTDLGGELPINPSGGVISCNPIGATGLIRVAEAALQLQGRGEERQVPGAAMALATGFGGCFWTDLMALGTTRPE